MVIVVLLYWPRCPWFSMALYPSVSAPVKIPAIPFLLSQGLHTHPNTHTLNLHVLDIEWQRFQTLECSSNVISTLLKARKASTNTMYDRVWNKFRFFAISNPIDPNVPSSSQLLDFLQPGQDLGLGLSILKVQVAAITTATSNRWTEKSLEVQFFKAVKKIHPPISLTFAFWDLSIVLEALFNKTWLLQKQPQHGT